MTYPPAARATPAITSKPIQKPHGVSCDKLVTAPRPWNHLRYTMGRPTAKTTAANTLKGVINFFSGTAKSLI